MNRDHPHATVTRGKIFQNYLDKAKEKFLMKLQLCHKNGETALSIHICFNVPSHDFKIFKNLNAMYVP